MSLVLRKTIWYAFRLRGKEPADMSKAGLQDAALLTSPTEDSRFRGAFVVAPCREGPSWTPRSP